MSKPALVVTVAPARATRETAYVLLAALAIILIAALIIRHNQKDNSHAATLAPYEISLRYDLKPAEQGIVVDLLLLMKNGVCNLRRASIRTCKSGRMITGRLL